MIAKYASAAARCPACGQPLDPPDVARCPLCKQSLAVEDFRATGEDITPYAKSLAAGRGGWLAMCQWVCTAGGQRLKHIALIRASHASRRFALICCLWFSLGLALVQGTRTGWNATRVFPDTPIVKPAGGGWMKLVTSSATNPNELWWNGAQSLIGAVVGGLSGLLILALWRTLAGVGVILAHPASFRGEQRMTAALHYSLAWGMPAFLASVLFLFRPLCICGETAKASWAPPDSMVLTVAGVLGAISATGWWIWLVRLGATAPPAVGSRVTVFMLVGAPGLAIALGAGWWFGWEWISPRLFTLMNMQF